MSHNRTPLLVHLRNSDMEKLASMARRQDTTKTNLAIAILEAGLKAPAPALHPAEKSRDYRGPSSKPGDGKAWR